MNHPNSISNCVICLETSAGLRGKARWMSSCCREVQHCTGTCFETNHNRLFFPHRRAQSGGERSLCWRAQESWFLSPRQCTTLSASHANKSLRKLLAIYTCHLTGMQGENAMRSHWKPPDFILLCFFSYSSKNIQHEKVADEEKVIKGYLYGERLQVTKLQALQQSVSMVWCAHKPMKISRLDLIKNKTFALLTPIQSDKVQRKTQI